MNKMIRGFDTPQLYREDAILRIRHLEAEIREHQRRLAALEAEALRSEHRIALWKQKHKGGY